MRTSTDTIINENVRSEWNPSGINLRYKPPVKQIEQEQKESVKFARNGSDPKENIKKFY